MYFFKASEIVNIAMRIEKNGLAFYMVLADDVEDPAAREVFSYMAREEELHYSTFEKMCGKLSSYNLDDESYPGEYENYLKALVDSNVFAGTIDPVEVASQVKNASEAVQMAIGFEKDSILLFNELKKLVPEEEKKAVDDIIEEEGRHIVKLLLLEKQIKGS